MTNGKKLFGIDILAMEKNYSQVKIHENKNYAVEKWLQDNTDVTNKTQTPLQDVNKTRGAFGGVHFKSNTGSDINGDSPGKGLLVYGDSVYQGHSKHSQSQQSDIETQHTASIENVLPKVFVVQKKSVKFDKQTNSDESRQLNNITSMTKVLAMSKCEDNERIRRKLQCANRYNFNTSRLENNKQVEDVTSNDEKYIQQKEVSSHVVDNDQSVKRTSMTSRQQTGLHEHIPSLLYYNNPVSQQIRRHEWRHSTKRTTVRAKSSRLPPSTSAGMLDPQTPIIRGLVVDVVDNQKSSVVRASKNANIREEFALKQKVESYRNACNNNINIINHAQRKLGASLKYLQNRQKLNKRCHSAPGSTTHGTDNRTVTHLDGQRDTSPGSNNVEFLIQSKGYVVETATPLKTYSFPALVYPTRRRLRIQHGE